MDELLTRATAWLALTLYVGGEVVMRRSAFKTAARWLKTVGSAAFMSHVACAFHFYHEWNHSAAYADTARQTAEMFGWRSGAGLYLNYLFAAVWLGEVCWSWMTPVDAARPAVFTRAIRAFFWFMLFNGAVVFARNSWRVYGLLLSVVLIACWWPPRGASTERSSCRSSV